MLDSFIRNTIFLDSLLQGFMKVNKNYKEELLNGLCFLNMASVLGHEAVHVNSTARSIYSSCAAVFLIKLKR